MGLFSRSNSTSKLTEMRDTEARTATYCEENAAEAARTGRPVNGISAKGWTQRAEKFQASADDYQQQINNKRRH